MGHAGVEEGHPREGRPGRLGHSTVGITNNTHSQGSPTLYAGAAEPIADLMPGRVGPVGHEDPPRATAVRRPTV